MCVSNKYKVLLDTKAAEVTSFYTLNIYGRYLILIWNKNTN